MNKLNNISNAINSLNSTDFIRVILYGDKNFDNFLTTDKVLRMKYEPDLRFHYEI